MWECLKIDAWDMNAWLLSSIDYDLRLLLYAQTEDAKTGANAPVPLLPLFNKNQNSSKSEEFKDLQALPIDELDALIEQQLKGVKDGE